MVFMRRAPPAPTVTMVAELLLAAIVKFRDFGEGGCFKARALEW